MMKTLVCLALVAIPTSVLAGTSQDCAQDKNYDLRIRACSDIIGRYGRSAAWAYVNRGIAYSEKGDQDRAIADFTTAIWINPREVEAYKAEGVSSSTQAGSPQLAEEPANPNKSPELNAEPSHALLDRSSVVDESFAQPTTARASHCSPCLWPIWTLLRIPATKRPCYNARCKTRDPI